MGILIIESKNVLPNGAIEYFQTEINTSLPKVRKLGHRYYFNSRVINRWVEQGKKHADISKDR